MEEPLEDIITARCLYWFGHLARMEATESPRRFCLVGYPSLVLMQHGTKMGWQDRVRKDLRKFDIDERTWYTEAQERAE